jgi:hypothetical protein
VSSIRIILPHRLGLSFPVSYIQTSPAMSYTSSRPSFARLGLSKIVNALRFITTVEGTVESPGPGIYWFFGDRATVGGASLQQPPGEPALPQPSLCFSRNSASSKLPTFYEEYFAMTVRKHFAVDSNEPRPREHEFVEIRRVSEKARVQVSETLYLAFILHS